MNPNISFLRELLHDYEDPARDLYSLQKKTLQGPFVINPMDYDFFKEYLSNQVGCPLHFNYLPANKRPNNNTLRSFSVLDMLVFSTDIFKITLLNSDYTKTKYQVQLSGYQFVRHSFMTQSEHIKSLIPKLPKTAQDYLWLVEMVESDKKDDYRKEIEIAEKIFDSKKYIAQLCHPKYVLESLIAGLIAKDQKREILEERAQLWNLNLKDLSNDEIAQALKQSLFHDLGLKNILALEQFQSLASKNISNEEFIYYSQVNADLLYNKIVHTKKLLKKYLEKNKRLLTKIKAES